MSKKSILQDEESYESLIDHSQYSYHIHKYEYQLNRSSSFDEEFQAAQSMYNLSESRFIDQLARADAFLPGDIDKGNSRLRILHLFQRGQFEEICQLFNGKSIINFDDEVSFKLGYSQFSQKQFAESLTSFQAVGKNSSYSNHVNYYSGMAKYFTGDYDAAIQSLQSVDNITPYEGYSPYYITQIYYEQKKYSEVIRYGEEKLAKQATLNKKDIQYLVGQAFYNKGNYESALTYLEQYEANTTKLTEQDFYQLGITNTKLGRTGKAKQYLSELIFCKSDLCQHAQYTLAGIHIDTGDEKEALALYIGLSKSASDKTMKEEALANAAMLHYALEDYQSSLKYASQVKAESVQYDECQALISNILSSSEDIQSSLSYLKSQNTLSPTLQRTLINLEIEQLAKYESNGDLAALDKGTTALSAYNLNGEEKSLVNYWRGLIAFNSSDFQEASARLSTATSLNTKREENKNYMLGYALIELGQDKEGIKLLDTYLKTLKTDSENKQLKQHLNLLIADTYTDNGEYTPAQDYYERAAKMKSPYAILQLAEIARVQKDYYTRIYLLESFTEQYQEHPQYQKTLFDIGETHIQLKEITRAITYLDQAISVTDGSNDITNESYLRLGLCHYNLGKYNQAIESYKQVAEHSTDANQKLIALEALKDIYLNDVGDTAEFFEFAEQSAQVEYSGIEKDSLAYLTNQKHYATKDYASAIKGYNSYLKKYPSGFYVNQSTIELADCHYELSQYEEAQTYYKSLHNADSEKLKTRALLRSALISLNYTEAYADALVYFQKLIPLAKDDKERLELIDGAFFSAIKTNDDAILELADMITTDTHRSDEEKAKAYYHKGKKLNSKKNDDGAILAFTEVTRRSKSNIAAEANYLIAEIFYLKGNLDSAERQANETTKRAKSYPHWIGKSLLLLTDIYIDKTDLLNARAACEVVLENFSDKVEIEAEAKEKMQMIELLEEKESRILFNAKDTLIFQEIDQND